MGNISISNAGMRATGSTTRRFRLNVVWSGVSSQTDIDQATLSVFVEMTLTSAGCGNGRHYFCGDVKDIMQGSEC